MKILRRVQIVCCQSAAETSRTSSDSVRNFALEVLRNYALVRISSSINTNNMAIQAALMSKRFVRLAGLQYSLKFISYFVADNAKFHYDQFIKKEVVNEKDQFLLFDLTKQQGDVFLLDYLSINPQYKELWSLRKLIFILQHGQSFTERGFSVSKK